MPYRKRIQTSATEDSQLLMIWREERAYRVGRALSYSGFILALIATIVDFIWSEASVFLADLTLLIGCLVTLYWIKSNTRPTYYWWPLYWGYWVSALPSLWTTGGLNSPFLGIALAGIYIMGTVLSAKNRSSHFLIFSILHIPALYLIEFYHPLSTQSLDNLSFSSVITALNLLAIFVCVHSMLKTEHALSLEFAEHYRNLDRTKEELKKSESRLREAQSIATIGSWEWDLEADHIYWSDELYKIFGITKEDFDPSFNAYLQRLRPEKREKIRATIQHTINTGADFSFENLISTPQGDKYVFSRGRAIKSEDGKITRMRGTSQDITDRKRIESQLEVARNELEKRVEERTLQLAQSLEREKTAKEQAESASQAKMQFLANMSHEIRTPMNSILGFSDLLSNEAGLNESGKDYLARIRNNGTQLLHLIDDILDLSKFEAGRIPIKKSYFSLRSLAEDVVSSFSPTLKQKGLELDLAYKIEEPIQVHTDPQRLYQILINLLGNSIKFSEKGTVRMTFSQSQKGDGKFLLRIDIEDNGIGISKENQKNLFQPFNQGDSSIVRKFGGSGLGLALSRRIAEALGGNLELKRSAPGEGSHFHVQVPIEFNHQEPQVRTGTASMGNGHAKYLANKSILLAEDSPDNVFLIRRYIESLGVTVDVAPDGIQAVKMATQKDYDCILMDVQMPLMDGLEATRQIRKQGYQKPIIALTAHALPIEAERSLEAGCNLHFTKPINRAELISTISEQLKPRAN